jgi:hypothetical protein
MEETVSKVTVFDRLQALKQARSLIAAGHAIGENARDAKGRSVQVDSPSAVTFCLFGAAMRASGYQTEKLMPPLYNAIRADLKHTEDLDVVSSLRLVKMNDHEGQEAVLRYYDTVIERVTREMEGQRMGQS